MSTGSSAFIISVNGSKTDVNVDNFEEASVVLNCTYAEEDGETIDGGRSITWRSSGSDGKNIAGFSKPGGDGHTFYSNGEYLRNRSKLYNPTENSTSALIVIENVLCGDDKRIFHCHIKYSTSDGPYDVQSDHVSISLKSKCIY